MWRVELQVMRGINEKFLPRNMILEVLPEQADEITRQMVEWLSERRYDLFSVEGRAWTIVDDLPEFNLWCQRR